MKLESEGRSESAGITALAAAQFMELILQPQARTQILETATNLSSGKKKKFIRRNWREVSAQ